MPLHILPFQLALPRRERHISCILIIIGKMFQLALPRRERQALSKSLVYLVLFQLALPRRERHWALNQLVQPQPVSTRAPAKGATCFALLGFLFPIVSTRAPAKGATLDRKPRQCFRIRFNSRSREGSDLKVNNKM